MSLENIRNKIDKIDDKIIKLLEERLKLAAEVIKFKKKVVDSKREEEILAKINSLDIQAIYKTIFKISKKKQREVKS